MSHFFKKIVQKMYTAGTDLLFALEEAEKISKEILRPEHKESAEHLGDENLEANLRLAAEVADDPDADVPDGIDEPIHTAEADPTDTAGAVAPEAAVPGTGVAGAVGPEAAVPGTAVAGQRLSQRGRAWLRFVQGKEWFRKLSKKSTVKCTFSCVKKEDFVSIF